MSGPRRPHRRRMPGVVTRKDLSLRFSLRLFRCAPAALAIAAAVPHAAHAAPIVRWAASGVAMCTATGTQQNPQVASDGAGGAFITWQDRRATYEDIYAQRVLADGTVAPGWPAQGLPVCTAAFNQSTPQITPDGAGGAIIGWTDGRSGGNTDIYAQRILPGGTVDPAWPSNGVAVCVSAGGQALPQIVSDGAGGAIVVWQDDRNGNPDIYAQRVLASGVVDPAWPECGGEVCTARKTQAGHQVATDGAGGALVTWHDARYHPTLDFYDIYAQRILPSGAIANGWPANGAAVCLATSNQLYPDITSDGAGGAIVTWFDRRFGQPIDPIYQDIFVQRLNAAGAPQWTPDGVDMCLAVNAQLDPRVVPDGAGGAFVVWQDHRESTYDIYAHHVRGDGSLEPGLPPDGVALSTAEGRQEKPQITADGAGGAIVVWQSAPSTGNNFTFAVRMQAQGGVDPDWPLNGVALCIAPASQENPQVASDGAGGAIVTWQDSRQGGTNPLNIYAQRINDGGCLASRAAGPLALQSCGLVEWTGATGGSFFDGSRWNGGAGPVPNGLCPATCLPYDARFGIGGSSYTVVFDADATSAAVTVAAGDHPSFDLSGNTYRMSELRLDGPGSALTVSMGTVAVDASIQIGQAAGTPRGLAGEGAATGPVSSFVMATSPAGGATLAPIGAPGGIVFQAGGALIGPAPLPYDLANSGTLSPGSNAGVPGSLDLGAGFTQSAAGRLLVDLGGSSQGTGYDVVRVAGPAALGGALVWSLVGSYLPPIGTRFEVLVAHPRVGVFASVREGIDVAYTDTSVVLIATATTPALVSLVGAEAEPGRVRVRWLLSGDVGEVVVHRDRGTGEWPAVALGMADGTGIVSYEDLGLEPGRYGYRLALSRGGSELVAGEVWVEVPVASGFGLAGVSPNPAHGPLAVSFSLADQEPASLELFDLAGRRLASRAIESPRQGNRVLTLSITPELRAGVYVLRLSQGVRRSASRIAMVR